MLAQGHVCFTPESGRVQCTRRCLLWAISGHRDAFCSLSALARTPIDMTPYAVRSGDLVYQVGEAATELRIKNVFDVFNAFIMRRRIKSLSQQFPFARLRHQCLHVAALRVLPDLYRVRALSARMTKNTPPKDHPNSRAACCSPISGEQRN